MIQKIDKENYINLATGEICQFNHNETRADDYRSIQKTMKLGRDIINANVVDPKMAKFITLTYADNMTDEKRLKRDTEFFIRKLKRRFGAIEYITAIEPQERGAWHYHMIVIFPEKPPFIPNTLISDLWGYGFTSTQKIDDVDNVGAYLTAYLTDVALTPDTTHLTFEGCEIRTHKDKRYIKGGRLQLYPKGMRIFRYSNGVKRPIIENMRYQEIKKEIGSAKPTYSSTVQIESDNFNSVIHKEYYNFMSTDYHTHKEK